jgi:D-serine ammonia-lyase
MASSEELKELFVGKMLDQLPTPFAVVDRSIASRNCKKMFDACKDLNILFRAHIKTHKVWLFDSYKEYIMQT